MGRAGSTMAGSGRVGSGRVAQRHDRRPLIEATTEKDRSKPVNVLKSTWGGLEKAYNLKELFGWAAKKHEHHRLTKHVRYSRMVSGHPALQ